MKKILYKNLLQFKDSESGGVVLIVAFILLGLLTAAGVAIDMSRVQSAKGRLSTCLDTAGLAAISKMGDAHTGSTLDWVTANVNKYFAVNCRFGYQDTTGVTITKLELVDDNILTMEAMTRQPTRLLSIVGINSVTITATSIVKRTSDSGIEVVLVLDNTGSMDAQVDPDQPTSAKKIDALKSAAKSLVKKLSLGNASLSSNAWIGIVPFAQAVNIGGTNTPNYSFNSNWVKFDDLNQDFGPTSGSNQSCLGTASTTLAQPNASPPAPATCAYPGKNNATFGHTYWYGCVTERKSPDDISDASPNQKFLPYLFPSQQASDVAAKYPFNQYKKLYPTGLGDMSFVNKLANYWKRLPSDTPSSVSSVTYVTPLWNVMNPPTVVEPFPLGPNAYCPSALTPMTHDTAALNNGIDAMTPNGQTIIPNALAWGWRMLSPNWKDFWGGDMGTAGLPLPYNQDDHIKAVIFMTDGNNYFFPGSYTAYEHLYDGKLGTTDEDKAEKELDSRTRQVCKKMKDKGITIYTIGFGPTDNIHKNAPSGQAPDVNGALLQYCASNKGLYFFAPTNDALDKAFDNIANSLLNPRVAQ